VTIFEEHIRAYQSGSAQESILIDTGIEYGKKLGGIGGDVTKYAAGFIIGFIYASVENTTTALINTIQYLAMPENRDILDNLRAECRNSVQTDFKQLLTAPLLNACIMETARLCPSFIAVPRIPTHQLQNLGPYFVEPAVNLVTLCGPLLHVYGNTESYFKNPTKFSPGRFLKEPSRECGAPEPTSSQYITTWGGGIHACPGKQFALYAIKICVAHFILNFDFEIEGGIPELNYHGALALGERDVKFRVKKRND